MPMDYRMDAAKYYDLCYQREDDIPFYLQRVPGPSARVLELGCGTGRVLVPLVKRCGYIHGIDCSEAMLTQCEEKLLAAGIPTSHAVVEAGDIANLNLGTTFDLIIAPYRVMQNLETDAEVEGFLSGIANHLAPDGMCILNVFMPNANPETLNTRCNKDERFDQEVLIDGERVVCTYRTPCVTSEPLVLYSDLIYRRYAGDELVDEAVLSIAMRCYYPDEFLALIEGHGFRVVEKWGGYAGETYCEGSELVVAFTR